MLGYGRGHRAHGNGSNPVSTGFAEALAHPVLRHRVTVRYSIGGARVGKQGHVVSRGLVQREGRPWRVTFTPAPGYTLKVIAHWAMSNLAPGWTVLSYSLVRLNAVAATAFARFHGLYPFCAKLATRRPLPSRKQCGHAAALGVLSRVGQVRRRQPFSASKMPSSARAWIWLRLVAANSRARPAARACQAAGRGQRCA